MLIQEGLWQGINVFMEVWEEGEWTLLGKEGPCG